MPRFLEDLRGSYADILVALYDFVSFLFIEIAFFNNVSFSASSSVVQTVLFICKQFAHEHSEYLSATVDVSFNFSTSVVDSVVESVVMSVVTEGM